MTVIEDRVIEPGGHWGRVIGNRQTLRIVDLFRFGDGVRVGPG